MSAPSSFRRLLPLLCAGCLAALPTLAPTPATGDGGSSPAAVADDWAVGTPASVGLSAAPLARTVGAIRAGEFKKIESVLVARHGKLVYEAYFGRTGADTLVNTRSATKSVTDLLIGIAIDRGLLKGADAPALPLFAGMAWKNPDPRKARITIEDLLTMSSALDCDDSNDASPGNEVRMHEVDDWIQFVLDLPVKTLPAGGPLETNAPGGRHFSYCTAGVVLLGGVLERATGQKVADFAHTNLFAPLGIGRTEWQYSPRGQAMTGGGLRLRSRDLLKLGQLVANGGTWNGKRVVSERWVKASVQPHVRIDTDTEYGYLWWLHGFESGGKTFAAAYMAGNGGNKVAVIPELDMVVVIASTNYNTKGMHEQTTRLLSHYILASAMR
jgi:CubicO group peptidase (beta-lactamase class C family)